MSSENCGGGPSDPYRNGKDWRPHGCLTVYDEIKGQFIGVEGIKVRARRWFTTYTGISDANARDYRNADNNVAESWSVGVQWALTKMEYPKYRGRRNGTPNYTNVVMDMIDSPGQELYGFGTTAPIDQVEGYNIVQIQNAFPKARNFETWKNNIKNSDENHTKAHLDALFNFWANN